MEFGRGGGHKWHHKETFDVRRKGEQITLWRLQLLLLHPTPLNATIVIDQNICSIFYWYHPSNGILLILVQQEGIIELHDSIVDWVHCDQANIILNTHFQAPHYHNCEHYVAQQSYESEPVDPPSSLREAAQVEHIGQIHVVTACIHIFSKLDKCFLDRLKPPVFNITMIIHHHSIARAHSLICPPNPCIATTAVSATIVATGITSFIVALSWVSTILTPKMSLHERLLAPFAWGGDIVDQHMMNMEGALMEQVM